MNLKNQRIYPQIYSPNMTPRIARIFVDFKKMKLNARSFYKKVFK